jgi:hypothetical protein
VRKRRRHAHALAQAAQADKLQNSVLPTIVTLNGVPATVAGNGSVLIEIPKNTDRGKLECFFVIWEDFHILVPVKRRSEGRLINRLIDWLIQTEFVIRWSSIPGSLPVSHERLPTMPTNLSLSIFSFTVLLKRIWLAFGHPLSSFSSP